MIADLGFADYFLVLWDVVREAKVRRIVAPGADRPPTRWWPIVWDYRSGRFSPPAVV